MAFFNTVVYKGEPWNYVFASADVFGMGDEDVRHLLTNIIGVYKEGENSRDVEGENYAGRITKRSHSVLGGLAGVLLEAELETPDGKRKPKVLLLNPVRADLN